MRQQQLLRPRPVSNTNQGSGAASGATASAYAGGIPFGMFAMPDEEFGTVYNGAMQNNAPQLLLQSLAQIKARGGKVAVMFAGQEDYYKEGGHFSFTEWKARIDRFKSVNFTSYINDGTIIGHYLIDEPNDPANWNGQPVPPSVLEEMARYSKQLWPDMVTIVRVEPGYLASNTNTSTPPGRSTSAEGTGRRVRPTERRRRPAARSRSRRGLNLLKGGTPNGSRMTASEVESWGSALLDSTYPCAFISWTYEQELPVVERDDQRDGIDCVPSGAEPDLAGPAADRRRAVRPRSRRRPSPLRRSRPRPSPPHRPSRRHPTDGVP